MRTVAVVDYGLGNINSIVSALHWIGTDFILASEPPHFDGVSGIILPGVGAFPQGMLRLERSGLDVGIKEAALKGVPILGICLGMQLLFSEGEEFGITAGLGLIPGVVRRLSTEHAEVKIPNVNWLPLRPVGTLGFSGSILNALNAGDEVYFVHSFAAQPESREHVLSETAFSGQPFCSTVCRELIFGCQYHPEKSGLVGLNILKNFINICKEHTSWQMQ